MTHINVENANKVIASIEAHRKAFNMDYWTEFSGWKTLEELNKVQADEFVVDLENIDDAQTTCGTTLCIAGFATMHAGWKTKYVVEGDSYGQFIQAFYVSPEGVSQSRMPEWAEIGIEFLDMEEKYARRLFHYTKDNDVALEALKALAAGTHPEDIYILTDESNHCECEGCAFDEDDYEE